MPESIRRVFA